MWDVVKADATTKSTLYLLDTEDQLVSMKLSENDNPKAHLNELRQHFQLMLQHCDNLTKMGPTVSNTHFNIIIMSSLLDSYRPTLQMIMAAECTSAALGASSSKKMKPDDLIAFLTEEAQHRVINDERTKTAESALAAHRRRQKRGKPHRERKAQRPEPGVTCENCNKPGHTKPDCWSKGGGKEGQGPRRSGSKKGEKAKESAAVAKVDENDLFAFTCTSDYTAEAKALNISNENCRACLDSGMSNHYCPNHNKFENYQVLTGCYVITTDGRRLKAIGIGDVHIELPNKSKQTHSVLKGTVHAPEMAFTLFPSVT